MIDLNFCEYDPFKESYVILLSLEEGHDNLVGRIHTRICVCVSESLEEGHDNLVGRIHTRICVCVSDRIIMMGG